MADPFIGIVSVLSFDDRRIVCEAGEISIMPKDKHRSGGNFFRAGFLMLGRGVRPIADSGTCHLFVTHLSNLVKILFALLTSDEGNVDH
jgi:hypothetical protein